MTITLLHGDCRAVLPTLPSASVQCIVTSPPYYGLRDYGTGTWSGGDAACDHAGPPMRTNNKPTDSSATFHGGTTRANEFYRDTCGKCGATRMDAQIGLERTPAEYVAALVEVFREVKRILRSDGVIWLNLGDSYARDSEVKWDNTLHREAGWKSGQAQRNAPNAVRSGGLKPKDLMMMPARVALALQADGWFLRSDIIWAKPNPMPESVTDRPTSAHEHVFLLAKSATYFYDADAVREPHLESSLARAALPWNGNAQRDHPSGATQLTSGGRDAGAPMNTCHPNGRNARNVWTIATAPFSAAHFATFPPALVERCIKAGTSERGCCAVCGAPWGRVTERTAMVIDRSTRTHPLGRTRASGTMLEPPTSVTTGWAPSCSCPPSEPAPCTVLDPFSGAGTTAMVADRLGRHAIGIDLSSTYGAMSRERIATDAGLFADFAPAAEAAE